MVPVWTARPSHVFAEWKTSRLLDLQFPQRYSTLACQRRSQQRKGGISGWRLWRRSVPWRRAGSKAALACDICRRTPCPDFLKILIAISKFQGLPSCPSIHPFGRVKASQKGNHGRPNSSVLVAIMLNKIDDASKYSVSHLPIHTPRQLRLICIGAGIAGIAAAYKYQRQLTNVSFVIYEKNDDIGGTWLENRYPGCACDIPAHGYTYSWQGNPEWSRL